MLLPLLLLPFAGDARAKEALVTGYHLKPATAAVMTGKSIKLNLVYCTVVNVSEEERKKTQKKPPEPDKKAEKEDDDLAPLVKPKPDDDLAPLDVMRLVCEGDPDAQKYLGDLTPLVVPKNVKWEVTSGQGKVSGDDHGATFQAPASKPDPNKATVTATFTNNVGNQKTILYSTIVVFDEVKTYSGTFRMHEVAINAEYFTDMSGDITFDFTEYYDVGGWREYEGKGKATYLVQRYGCSKASFAGVPVEGRLKVYDNGGYEMEVGLISEAQITISCKRYGNAWQEEISPAGAAMNSGDACATKEFIPRYDNKAQFGLSREGRCKLVRDAYEESWLFRATR